MRKLIALLEVVGVLVVGYFIASLILGRLDIEPMDIRADRPDFLALSVSWLQTSSVIYGCLLVPAFLLGWWRRRWRPANYGVTRAGQPVLTLVGAGLLAFVLVALPMKLLLIANEFTALGARPAIWALFNKEWTFSFWVFNAVANLAFQPALEELFYRGYCQTRLEEEFGGGGAILIVSFFMVLAHNQYHHLDILNVGIIVLVLPAVIGMGYLYWRTRSLIPGLVLHSAVNFATKGNYLFVLTAAMLVALIWFRRLWWPEVEKFGREFVLHGGTVWVWAATLIIGSINIGFEKRPQVFIVVGGLCLAFALASVFRDRAIDSRS
jgi:membrane protease YdiL (CAAX protease family)